ncbi:hypothetical protein ACOZ4N_11230 [Halorientalis pallida]|uniref:hypothetical protein n=1 Tax=Halorientalis pallida TaxID=2479928 RepID=UPI003C700CEE
MHHYEAYGLTIESVFQLPELATPAQDVTAPDVVIREGDLTPVKPAGDQPGRERRIDAGPSSCRISYADLGTFRIEDGERVLVDVDAGTVPETVAFRRVLEGQILGVLLHLRGTLLLHASAVATDDGAVVFLGDVGAGKSTTATAFEAAGHRLLDDDIVPIRFREETPVVAPGIPQLKLSPEVADTLDVDVAGEPRDDGKLYVRVDSATGRDWVPLRCCFVLTKGPELSVRPVPPRDRFVVLVDNTYTASLLDETEAMPEHFRRCARLIETTPLRELRRPQRLTALPDLVETVVEDVRADGEGPRRANT